MNDLWTTLAGTEKPIVLYGMGNGADKIADELAKRGVPVADYFASDGFVRGQFFRGKRVLRFEEVKAKYRDFIILVAFASSLPEVMENIRLLDREYELYIPDVPVAGETLFDSSFYETNRAFLREVRELLADEASRVLLDEMIAFKLTGKLSYLEKSCATREEVYAEILRPECYRTCVDLGGYTGDSVREFLVFFKNQTRVISLEPDPKNFKRLSRYVEENGLDFAELHQAAAGNIDGEIFFEASGNRNARIGTGGGKGVRSVSIPVRRLDSILLGERADYIKYDVEGNEYEALQGSRDTLRRHRPDLLVSLYHRSEDLFRLPLYLASLNCGYRFFLRRFAGYPAWDLNLYAVGDKQGRV